MTSNGFAGAADGGVTAPDEPAGAFARWLHSRPFWGGLLVIVAGCEIAFSVRLPMYIVLHVGLQGLAAYAVPAVIVLCGLLLWFTPDQRPFYSILATLLSLASWFTSNMGGFGIGMVLGLVGGALAFGWAPPSRRAQPAVD